MKVDLKAIHNKQKAIQKTVIDNTTSGLRKSKPKVHKLKFGNENMTNPNKAFDIFDRQVTTIISKKDKVDASSFYAELKELFNRFIDQNQLDKINKNSQRFAEKLVSLGDGRLAGIIYSLLIKVNASNPELVEHFATNGLAIAKRFHDPVHIMARCEDLRKIYNVSSPQSDKMLKVLYEEKRALNTITKNYKSAQDRFQTISKELKPVDNYKIMQGGIQIQIAKILKNKDKNAAIEELRSAYNLLSSVGKGKYTEDIEKLLDELNTTM